MIAVVTGGGSGIGRAVTDRLRDGGADVVVWDLDGGDIDCDISDPAAVTAALDRTVADHGPPDRLVACAGIGASGLLLEQAPADFIDDGFQLRRGYGAFFAGLQQPLENLLALKALPAPVFLGHHVGNFVDALVGGEAPGALQALAAAPDCVADTAFA